MVCSCCGGLVMWCGPLSNLTHTECTNCGAKNSQVVEDDEQEWDMSDAFRRIVEERVTQPRGVVVTPISTNTIYGAYTSKPEVSQ